MSGVVVARSGLGELADEDMPPAHAALTDRGHVTSRVTVAGKLLRLNGDRWYVKGLTYGPFPPAAGGRIARGGRDMRHRERAGGFRGC